MRADAARDERRADDGEDRRRAARTPSPAASTSGSTARSASATYIAGSTITKSVARISSIVERAAGVAGDAAEQRRRCSIAPSAAASDSAERHARAEQQPAEDVAAEAVGAEQQQRRAPLRPTIATRRPPREPRERHRRRSILFVALLELVRRSRQRIDERRVPRVRRRRRCGAASAAR